MKKKTSRKPILKSSFLREAEWMPEEILPEEVGSWHVQKTQSLVQMQVQSVCQKMVCVIEYLRLPLVQKRCLVIHIQVDWCRGKPGRSVSKTAEPLGGSRVAQSTHPRKQSRKSTEPQGLQSWCLGIYLDCKIYWSSRNLKTKVPPCLWSWQYSLSPCKKYRMWQLVAGNNRFCFSNKEEPPPKATMGIWRKDTIPWLYLF